MTMITYLFLYAAYCGGIRGGRVAHLLSDCCGRITTGFPAGQSNYHYCQMVIRAPILAVIIFLATLY